MNPHALTIAGQYCEFKQLSAKAGWNFARRATLLGGFIPYLMGEGEVDEIKKMEVQELAENYNADALNFMFDMVVECVNLPGKSAEEVRRWSETLCYNDLLIATNAAISVNLAFLKGKVDTFKMRIDSRNVLVIEGL